MVEKLKSNPRNQHFLISLLLGSCCRWNRDYEPDDTLAERPLKKSPLGRSQELPSTARSNGSTDELPLSSPTLSISPGGSEMSGLMSSNKKVPKRFSILSIDTKDPKSAYEVQNFLYNPAIPLPAIEKGINVIKHYPPTNEPGAETPAAARRTHSAVKLLRFGSFTKDTSASGSGGGTARRPRAKVLRVDYTHPMQLILQGKWHGPRAMPLSAVGSLTAGLEGVEGRRGKRVVCLHLSPPSTGGGGGSGGGGRRGSGSSAGGHGRKWSVSGASEAGGAGDGAVLALEMGSTGEADRLMITLKYLIFCDKEGLAPKRLYAELAESYA